MQFKSFAAAAAVLLAFAPTAFAVGTATVINQCGFPIFYASVSQGKSAALQELQGSYSEQYSTLNDGVSIKLSPDDSLSGAISQFEFTRADGKIYYDISNINGYPFSANGMEIVPSTTGDSSNPSCVPISCPAGQAVCTAAYNAPDDIRTMVCNEDTNLVLTMCPGSFQKRSEPTPAGHLHRRNHPRSFPKM